jgi:hypothetical protein
MEFLAKLSSLDYLRGDNQKKTSGHSFFFKVLIDELAKNCICLFLGGRRNGTDAV